MSVGEVAFCTCELNFLQRISVYRSHGCNRFADLLTIGADVLNRRRAYLAGDARQTLDAGQAAPNALGDKVIPVLSGCNARRLCVELHALQVYFYHQSAKALVGKYHVAAAA